MFQQFWEIDNRFKWPPYQHTSAPILQLFPFPFLFIYNLFLVFCNVVLAGADDG